MKAEAKSGDAIFLVAQDGLARMERVGYSLEADLQSLLAEHPDLLAGEQVDSESPRRWLLVKAEQGIPREEGGGGHWALDHLFLDQDGVPTLVEVKRSADNRARREVVAQMLDYAANAMAYMPADRLRAEFESQAEAAARLDEFLAEEQDAEEFWSQVATQLDAKRLRLVFVADRIPRELRTIVEFLNEQMDPCEVLAVEVRQYKGADGQLALVPRVVGWTAESEQRKSRGGRRKSRQWDEESFFEEMERQCSHGEVEACQRVLAWARRSGHRLRFGSGAKHGWVFPVVCEAAHTAGVPFVFGTRGHFEVRFKYLGQFPPYNDRAQRSELAAQLKQLTGADLSETDLDSFPWIPIMAIAEEEKTSRFLEIYDQVAERLSEANPGADQ